MKRLLTSRVGVHPLALLVSLVVAGAIATNAQAQEASPQTPPTDVLQQEPDEGGLGGHLMLGGVAVPDYEGSEDYEIAPLFSGKISYDTYYIETKGLGVRVNVSPLTGFEFGPAIGARMGRGDVENDRVDDLRNIDDTIEAGAFAKISTTQVLHPSDEIAFEIEVLTDLGDTHDGTTVSFGPSYGFSPIERVRLGMDISATYASGNYTDTYFGINARDARRSGLSQYDADGGIKDIGVTISATYQWNEHWAITAIGGYTQLVGDAADSPIVDDEGSAGQGMVGAGLSYRF